MIFLVFLWFFMTYLFGFEYYTEKYLLQNLIVKFLPR
jgi:hypothetical protein